MIIEQEYSACPYGVSGCIFVRKDVGCAPGGQVFI